MPHPTTITNCLHDLRHESRELFVLPKLHPLSHLMDQFVQLFLYLKIFITRLGSGPCGNNFKWISSFCDS